MKQSVFAPGSTCLDSNLNTRRLPAGGGACAEELVHELRQPLGVIETLAYYLELTSLDEKTSAHARQIQAMVQQVNTILLAASAKPVHEPMILTRSAAS